MSRALTLALSLLAVSWTASAELQNPGVMPMGDKQAFLGNTGAAISSSAGSVFYNPAGLVGINGPRLVMSGSTYAVINNSIDTDSKPLNIRQFGATPNSLVSVRKAGDYLLAFSLLVPLEINFQAYLEQDLGTVGGNSRTILNARSQESFLGLSAATELSPSWRAGVTAFAYRVQSYSNTFFSYDFGSTNGISSAVKDQETFSAFLVAGVQQKVSEAFQWGLSLHSETLRLSGSADIYQEALSAGGTTSREVERVTVRANTKLPWQVLTGFQFKGGRHTLTADLGLSFPTSLHTLPHWEDDAYIRTKLTARGSLGYAFEVNRAWSLLSGVHYNPSTYAKTDNRGPSAHFMGASFGVQNEERRVKTGAGMYYLFSRTDRDFFGPSPRDRSSISVYGFMLTAGIDY